MVLSNGPRRGVGSIWGTVDLSALRRIIGLPNFELDRPKNRVGPKQIGVMKLLLIALLQGPGSARSRNPSLYGPFLLID